MRECARICWKPLIVCVLVIPLFYRTFPYQISKIKSFPQLKRIAVVENKSAVVLVRTRPTSQPLMSPHYC